MIFRHPRLLIVIPAPAYARAGYGGNQLCAGRKPLRRQSRRELDGDFISPSFSRLRESTLLPFCYLRESANGDLSPKMANPCGGKAAGNFRRQRRRNTQPHFAAQQTAAFSHLALQDGLRYAQMAKMRR